MDAKLIFKVSDKEMKRIDSFYERSKEEIELLLKVVKKWLEAQPHLPQVQDDTFLEMMLKLNKFDLEKTQKKLDMFFSIKHIVPEFFQNRSPLQEELKKFMDTFMILPLPQLTEDLNRVYIVKFLNNNPADYNLLTNAKFLLNLFDLRLHYDPAPGDIYVYDLSDLRFGHLLKVNPMIVKNIYTVMEKVYSNRLKGIHFLNMPITGHALVTIAKYVLTEKLSARIHTHKNIDSLTTLIPSNILPSDYNGGQNCLDDLYENWREFIESKTSWLLDLAEKKSIEDLRPEENINTATIRNLYGLFGNSFNF